MATALWAAPKTVKPTQPKTQVPKVSPISKPASVAKPRVTTATVTGQQNGPVQGTYDNTASGGGKYVWDAGSSTYKWQRPDGQFSGATKSATGQVISGTDTKYLPGGSQGTANTALQSGQTNAYQDPNSALNKSKPPTDTRDYMAQFFGGQSADSSIGGAQAGLTQLGQQTNAALNTGITGPETADPNAVAQANSPTYAPDVNIANSATGLDSTPGNSLAGYKSKLDEMLASADNSRQANMKAVEDMQAQQQSGLQSDYTEKQAALKADLASRGILDSSTTGKWLTKALSDHDQQMQGVASQAAAKLADLVASGSMERTEAELKYAQLLQGIESENRNYNLRVQEMAQSRQDKALDRQAQEKTSALEQARIDRLDVQNRVDYAKSLGYTDPTEFGGTGERSAISTRLDNANQIKQMMGVGPGGVQTGQPTIQGQNTIARTNQTLAKTAGASGGGGGSSGGGSSGSKSTATKNSTLTNNAVDIIDVGLSDGRTPTQIIASAPAKLKAEVTKQLQTYIAAQNQSKPATKSMQDLLKAPIVKKATTPAKTVAKATTAKKVANPFK